MSAEASDRPDDGQQPDRAAVPAPRARRPRTRRPSAARLDDAALDDGQLDHHAHDLASAGDGFGDDHQALDGARLDGPCAHCRETADAVDQLAGYVAAVEIRSFTLAGAGLGIGIVAVIIAVVALSVARGAAAQQAADGDGEGEPE